MYSCHIVACRTRHDAWEWQRTCDTPPPSPTQMSTYAFLLQVQISPGSVDNPMIDMATSQAENSTRSQGAKRVAEPPTNMPSNERARSGAVSSLNDTHSLLNDQEGNGNNSLLNVNVDEVTVLIFEFVQGWVWRGAVPGE